jgi:hypothetical protein
MTTFECPNIGNKNRYNKRYIFKSYKSESCYDERHIVYVYAKGIEKEIDKSRDSGMEKNTRSMCEHV